MKHKVSCVIVNYNDSNRSMKLTKRIISYDNIAHVIVVDNCSTDNSLEVLKSFINEKYILLESEKNGGYGYGNNLGIHKAYELGDDRVLIANPDVVFSEDCLSHMLHTMDKIDNCVAIGAKETYLGTYAWRYTSGLHDVLSTSLLFNKLLKQRYYGNGYFLDKAWAIVDIIPGCFMLVKTKEFSEYGLYDEDFFLYEEEKVFFKKMTQAGFKLAIDLEVSFEHRHVDGDLNIKKCLVTKQRLIKSKRIFLIKYRQFTPFEILLCDIFFIFCYLEMLLYASLKQATSIFR